MLSRVAESIYWMSRQVERAENMARFLETTSFLMLDCPEAVVEPWWPLIKVTADAKEFFERYPVADRANVVRFIAFDSEYSNSMISSLRSARENARSVRESLSSEAYEAINDFYQYVKKSADSPDSAPDDFLTQARQYAIHWSGVVDSTMPRDVAWNFANVGRLLERADKTSRILDVKYYHLLPDGIKPGTALDDLQWAALLRACSGIEAYRRAHHSIDLLKVVEFFLFNESFPRSVRHCVDSIVQSLDRVHSFVSEDHQSTALQSANELYEHMLSFESAKVVSGGMHEFVDALQLKLNGIGSDLNLDYFHQPTPA